MSKEKEEKEKKQTEFSELIREGIQLFGMQQFADDCGVSIGTLNDWALEIAMPPSHTREHIIRYIMVKLPK